ncbi:hypothetical protein FT986_03695 [Mesonia sp. K4-1]|nr:hypothetical protein FT986_03695 [Mesonia sp. K4-1]
MALYFLTSISFKPYFPYFSLNNHLGLFCSKTCRNMTALFLDCPISN